MEPDPHSCCAVAASDVRHFYDRINIDLVDLSLMQNRCPESFVKAVICCQFEPELIFNLLACTFARLYY